MSKYDFSKYFIIFHRVPTVGKNRIFYTQEFIKFIRNGDIDLVSRDS